MEYVLTVIVYLALSFFFWCVFLIHIYIYIKIVTNRNASIHNTYISLFKLIYGSISLGVDIYLFEIYDNGGLTWYNGSSMVCH